MKKALRDYARARMTDDAPVREKAELFAPAGRRHRAGPGFCDARNMDLREALGGEDVFKQARPVQRLRQHAVGQRGMRKAFNVYENTVTSLYEACKPEILRKGKGRQVAAFQYLRGVIDSIVDQVDIDAVILRIGVSCWTRAWWWTTRRNSPRSNTRANTGSSPTRPVLDLSKIELRQAEARTSAGLLQEYRDRRSARLHPA
jgi:hypothetical protein